MTNDADTNPVATWRREGERVVLVGRKCQTCGKVAFSAAHYCDVCCGQSFAPAEIGSAGKLYSFSEIHIAPRAFKTPYVVGYVDMSETVRVFGQIENAAADLRPGARVEVTVGPVRTDDSGHAVESYKFRVGGA